MIIAGAVCIHFEVVARIRASPLPMLDTMQDRRTMIVRSAPGRRDSKTMTLPIRGCGRQFSLRDWRSDRVLRTQLQIFHAKGGGTITSTRRRGNSTELGDFEGRECKASRADRCALECRVHVRASPTSTYLQKTRNCITSGYATFSGDTSMQS